MPTDRIILRKIQVIGGLCTSVVLVVVLLLGTNTIFHLTSYTHASTLSVVDKQDINNQVTTNDSDSYTHTTIINCDENEDNCNNSCDKTDTIVAGENLVYIVRPGDTLSKISGKTFYSVDELAEYNHIENVNMLYCDESIRIPNE